MWNRPYCAWTWIPRSAGDSHHQNPCRPPRGGGRAAYPVVLSRLDPLSEGRGNHRIRWRDSSVTETRQVHSYLSSPIREHCVSRETNQYNIEFTGPPQLLLGPMYVMEPLRWCDHLNVQVEFSPDALPNGLARTLSPATTVGGAPGDPPTEQTGRGGRGYGDLRRTPAGVSRGSSGILRRSNRCDLSWCVHRHRRRRKETP